jgi:hypothetical protein
LPDSAFTPLPRNVRTPGDALGKTAFDPLRTYGQKR